MTASALAALLRGRRTGKGKWMGFCPSHRDKHRSLSISEGRKGIVMCCMSHQCAVKDILAAMGLTFADLFDGKPVDRDTLRKIHLEDERRARVAAELHRLRLSALDRASMWAAVRDAIGGLLMTHDTDNRLDYLFKYALAQSRLWEQRHDSLDYPRLRGLGVPKLRRDITVQDVGKEIAGRLGIK